MKQSKAAAAVVTPSLSSSEEAAPNSSVRPVLRRKRAVRRTECRAADAGRKFPCPCSTCVVAGVVGALGPAGIGRVLEGFRDRERAREAVVYAAGPRSVEVLASALTAGARRWSPSDVARVALEYAKKGYGLDECSREDAFVLLRGFVAKLEPDAIAFMNAGRRPPGRPRPNSSIKARVSDAFFYAVRPVGGPARKAMLQEEVRLARQLAKRLTGRATIAVA